MVEASSLGLADSLTDEEVALGLLYPRIERSTLHAVFVHHLLIMLVCLVREISADIAKEVIRKAQKAVMFPCLLLPGQFLRSCQGVDRSPDLQTMNDHELLNYINRKMWKPFDDQDCSTPA
jgi:malate dehydrogenase (oxaloacetate-decarboxylating)(NADP+)